MKNINKSLIILALFAFLSLGTLAQNNTSTNQQQETVENDKTSSEKIQTKDGINHTQSLNSIAPVPEQLNQKRLHRTSENNVAMPENRSCESTDDLCAPSYTTGCADGWGFTDFAVEEIQNYDNGCENTNDTGWSQYYDLGPATLVQGFTHTFTIRISVFGNTTSIWIDFNDDDELTPDEKILAEFAILLPGEPYDIDITIPEDATPGLHKMRVMCVFYGFLIDPCGSYDTGEAEDYMVNIVAPSNGSLEGYVTENAGGAGVAGALVSAGNGNYTAISGSDGYYMIPEINQGDWSVSCTREGFNPVTAEVSIVAGNTTTQDFALTAPTMELDPMSIEVMIEPDATTTEYVTIANNGDGPLHWNAFTINETGKSFLSPESPAFAYNAQDMIGAIPVGPISFYLNSPDSISQFGPAAFDYLSTADWVNGTWYGCVYGGTLITIDMVTGESVIIGACPDLTGMAYDWTSDEMYGVDFYGNLYTIDLATGAGTLIGTGEYGAISMVCDNNGSLFAWNSLGNWFGSIDKTSGAFTVISTLSNYFNYAQDASVDHETNTIYWAAYDQLTSSILYTVDQTTGETTYIGHFASAMEITGFAIPGSPAPWISISTYNGDIEAGGDGQLAVQLDATGLAAGTVHEADIHFSSTPDVGTQDVHVKMTVGGQDWGYVEGYVTLEGSAPYNVGDITEVIVSTGLYSASPDATGFYSIEVFPGTYDVTATLYGYETTSAPDITVTEGGTETVNFSLPILYGIIEGTITDANSGTGIEGAAVELLNTEFETTTAADGSYIFNVEAGNYDIKVTAPFYTPQTANVDVMTETTTTQDFSLVDIEGIIVVFDPDPVPNAELVPILKSYFPEGTVEYTTTIDGFPLDEQVQTVFLLLGTYPSSHVLTQDESVVVVNWLDTYGGNIYMEGGDTWAYDPLTSLHGYFNINGVSDGGVDLTQVDGIDSYWTAFSWPYTGANEFLDHIEAIAPAFPVLENTSMKYYTGVAYDAGDYKTVGTSHKITGLDDPETGFKMGVACVMAFFGYPVFEDYGNLEGTVTDEIGNPIEGALVDCGGFDSAETNANGQYLIENIPAGNWTATCTKEGYNPDSTEVTIVSGETTLQDFELTIITDINEPTASKLTIHPNPATEVINVISDDLIYAYEVLNNTGQAVTASNTECTGLRINVSRFERGIYYLKLKTTEGTVLRKIVIK